MFITPLTRKTYNALVNNQFTIYSYNWIVEFTSYDKGLISEFFVSIYLLCKGYKILKHRYKNYFGEIDFICKKGMCIIFLEVKFRRSSDCIEEVISKYQQARIRKAAAVFMKKYHGMDARFDAIFVSPWKIEHIQNVF